MRVLLAFLCSAIAFGANSVYLGQASAGANDGSSCANQKVYTYFNSASNWSATPTVIQIGPATTVHLCGTITGSASTNSQGLTAQGVIASGTSGTSGNPITIVFEAGAKMSTGYWGTAITLTNQQYFIVDGGTACGATQGGVISANVCNGVIENTANGTGLANSSHSTFIYGVFCENCEVKNMGMYNNYIHTQCELSSGCDISNAGTTENSMINMGGTNFKFHDSRVHDGSWCVNYQASSGNVNILLYNNEIYNCGHSFAVFGGVTMPGPVNVYNNNIHDYQAWDTGTADAYHEDGIHVFGNNLAEVNIYNNQWATQSQCCITGEIFMEAGGSAWTSAGIYRIFNNLFLQSSGAVNGLVQAYIGTSPLMIQNTIVGPGGSATGLFMSGTNALFQNNIIGSFPNLVNFNANVGTTWANIATDLDYQAYGDTSGFNSWVGGVDTGSFTTWKAGCSGCDTHSSYNASLHLNANGTPTSSSTSIVGQGKNLTSLCSGAILTLLCSDIFGVARPSSGAWDIGAAQLSGTPHGGFSRGGPVRIGGPTNQN